MFDSGMQGFLALLARDDVKTILTLATTIISVYVFLRRVREEGRKTRIAQLETRSLDQLFQFRAQLVGYLDRFEELPEVTNNDSARKFAGMLQAIRRDLRKSIAEYALFASAVEHEEHVSAFQEADRNYRALLEHMARNRVDYNFPNRFKRIVYQLLAAADIRIVQIQELDGRSRAKEKELIESKYEASIAEIDELLGQPDEWMPVHGTPSSPPSAAAT